MLTMHKKRISSNREILLPRNPTGFKGVYSRRAKYCAHIRVDGRLIHLGTFNTLKEAALEYNNAAKAHFGEFALLNSL